MNHFGYLILNSVFLALIPFCFTFMNKRLRYMLNYIYLGVLLVFSNLLGSVYSFSIETTSTIRISGGNVAYVAILMTTLLIVINEQDLTIIRNFIYSIIFASIFFFFFYSMINWILNDSSIVNPMQVSPEIFNTTINIIIAGAFLLVFELYILVIIFEKIKKITTNIIHIYFIYTLTFLLIIIIDGILFPISAFTLDPGLANMIVGSMQGKIILGTIFSLPLILFLFFKHDKLQEYIEQPLSLRTMAFWTKNELIQQIHQTEKSLMKSEKRLLLIKQEEERYQTMLQHFLKNDFHFIINQLKLCAMRAKAITDKEKESLNDIIEYCFKSAKTIDTVNKINEVLKTEIKFKKKLSKSIDLHKVFSKVITDLKHIKILTNEIFIKTEDNINKELMIGCYPEFCKYLEDVFIEIFHFIADKTKEKITIESIDDSVNSTLSINISSFGFKPIPEVISKILSSKITDKWDSQGHYIGISLVNVIMQQYGGQLNIITEDTGNIFQLIFPSIQKDKQ